MGDPVAFQNPAMAEEIKALIRAEMMPKPTAKEPTPDPVTGEIEF